MNTNWKDMTKQEKVRFWIYCVLAVIGAGFAVADTSGTWKHADLGWLACVIVAVVMECMENWNKNRKRAILEIVAGLIVAVACIGGKLL